MRIGIWIALFVTFGLAPAGAVESGLPSLASTAPIDCIHSGRYALLPTLQRAADGRRRLDEQGDP